MAGMRIGGMATGLDTDTLVKQMMQPYNMKVDKQKQDKQVIQWKQDIYRELINDTRGLKNSYMDNIKPNDNLLMQKNYSGYDISSSVGSSSATATAGVGAVEGNYIVNVTELAKGAKVSGIALVGKTTSSKLSELTPNLLDGNKITFAVNGEAAIDITVDGAASMTIQQFTDKVDSETNGTVIARFSELTQSFSFETKGQGELATLDISGSEDLMQALKIDGGIPAILEDPLDPTSGIITLAKKLGRYANLTVVPPGGDIDNPISVDNKATNNFTIDGINYALKGIGETTLSVTVNTDKTYDKIMGFITKYNELIDKVKEKVEQKKQYSFKPLTEDQKKEMEPEEIKIWEDKAKEGLIKGDSNLNSMLSSMRSAFFDSVEGVSITLKDLGFTTSKDYTQRGKIVVDESLTADQAKKKFSDALKSNGPGVADLFSKSGENDNEKGIFQKLNAIVEDYTNPFGEKGILLKKAGIKGNTTEFKNLLSEQMKQKDKFISELTKKLAVRENSFYTRFARLEVAMNKLNSQSSWLTQQFSQGQ
ncbi:flagellar filament capping protein FliD [Clostridium sp.]|uniref:flagellar filament capping protein FliD n=1 Tax=Clostridium sp. TaxID=1506 RepID=UPI003D6CAA9E